VKCADTVGRGEGGSGYDAGKKIKGRKRHILTDTQGLMLGVTVTPASVQDRDGAKVVCSVFCHQWQRLEVIFADGGYAGKLKGFIAQASGLFGERGWKDSGDAGHAGDEAEAASRGGKGQEVKRAGAKQPWPNPLAERIRAVEAALHAAGHAVTAEDFTQHFSRAKTADLQEILESLVTQGRARKDGERFRV